MKWHPSSLELWDEGLLSEWQSPFSKVPWPSPQVTAQGRFCVTVHIVGKVMTPNAPDLHPSSSLTPSSCQLFCISSSSPQASPRLPGADKSRVQFWTHMPIPWEEGCSLQGTRKLWIATYSCRLYELHFVISYIVKQLFRYLGDQMKLDFSFDAISMKLSSFCVCILWRNKGKKDEKKNLRPGGC